MSGSQEEELLRNLVESEWIDVVAMPVQTNRDILLDIVFSIPEGAVAVTGKAHQLSDGSEEFSLDIYPHVRSGWWATKKNGTTEWTARNLERELLVGPFKQLLHPPRSVRFFVHSRLGKRVYSTSGYLDKCSGIQFCKGTGINQVVLGIVASSGFPCALEIATEPEALASLFEGSCEARLWNEKDR